MVEPKRVKVEELPSEVACSLVKWLIDDFADYNGPVLGGSKKENGTVKQRYWAKWASQLESLGYPRNAEQVKKKINGEVKFVRERLSSEKIEAMRTGGGKKKSFPKLSEARQMLYEFLSGSEEVAAFEGMEAGEEPVAKKSRPTVDEFIDVETHSDTEYEFERNLETPNAIDEKKLTTTPRAPPTFMSRVKGSSARPALQDVSELRRQLLKTELETARVKHALTVQLHENAIRDGARIDAQLENEKIKRELLLNECRLKGIELLEEMESVE